MLPVRKCHVCVLYKLVTSKIPTRILIIHLTKIREERCGPKLQLVCYVKIVVRIRPLTLIV